MRAGLTDKDPKDFIQINRYFKEPCDLGYACEKEINRRLDIELYDLFLAMDGKYLIPSVSTGVYLPLLD